MHVNFAHMYMIGGGELLLLWMMAACHNSSTLRRKIWLKLSAE